MDIIIRLNIDPYSPVGLKITYLTNCSNQLQNIYNVVNNLDYKNCVENLLSNMCTYILNDNIIDAENLFNTEITNLLSFKDAYFIEFGNFFKNQYLPPV